jgi:hypothetical protein
MEKLKNVSITLVLIVIFILFVIRACFTVNDKIGFNIPVDKTGRQIFIQSWDYYYEPAISVVSDFDDFNFFQRIWVKPMRTTIKLRINNPDYAWDENSVNHLFNLPIDSLFVNNNSTFTLNKKREIPMTEFKVSLRSDSIYSIKQLLEGMGFEKILFINPLGVTIEKKLSGKSIRNMGLEL